MSVLVTGGAGYIGSVAVERLVAAGEDVVVLDDLSMGHRAAVHPQAEFIEASILDTPVLDQLFATHHIDTVMHFAAFSLVGESCENPVKYFDNNVCGAHSVLKSMLRAGVPRFILSSTASTYGNVNSEPITEDMPTGPLNPYGLSKRIIEQMLEWHDKAARLQYVSLRYFNACGASERYGEDHDPETHIIPNVLAAAAGTRDSVSIFGTDYSTPDGTCVRDYIHIEDLADAHIAAMNYMRRGGCSEIINLGNSIGNSVREIIESVKKVTGRQFKVIETERRPGDADVLVASSEKARRLLGWSPVKSDIDTIVGDAWRWFESHPNGYDGETNR
ncbi:MAG: UDP-glucose 4-epimerase GalE [Candidatus Hydrogenedentes bacterium]|nr:UDP-glucose 4-epimerase GalE [Candidatus Hydrogenedentota bacterium]